MDNRSGKRDRSERRSSNARRQQQQPPAARNNDSDNHDCDDHANDAVVAVATTPIVSITRHELQTQRPLHYKLLCTYCN